MKTFVDFSKVQQSSIGFWKRELNPSFWMSLVWTQDTWNTENGQLKDIRATLKLTLKGFRMSFIVALSNIRVYGNMGWCNAVDRSVVKHFIFGLLLFRNKSPILQKHLLNWLWIMLRFTYETAWPICYKNFRLKPLLSFRIGLTWTLLKN